MRPAGMSVMTATYTGRFAPTPSGPLHFGSIIAALAGFLDARRHGGRWMLRIDDLDLPRVRPGATDAILHTLESLGLHWDGEVLYQSRRGEAYRAGLRVLEEKNKLYRCYCPRRVTRGGPYPGTCRLRKDSPVSRRYALRVITGEDEVGFRDGIQGPFSLSLQDESGDFIIRRADGLFAYHLANVVDDAWQGITHVVRGADLLAAAPAQIYLQDLLGLPCLRYFHVPVALGRDGSKISKSADAGHALQHGSPVQVLLHALRFLGQEPEPALEEARLDEVLDWAVRHWRLDVVPRLPGQDVLQAFSH
jgi:glutamyl-Q tRNA(Asp) synthetase